MLPKLYSSLYYGYSKEHCSLTCVPLLWDILFSNYKLNYHDPKHPASTACNIWNHWTAILTLLSLISSVYNDLPTGNQTSDYILQCWNSTTGQGNNKEINRYTFFLVKELYFKLNTMTRKYGNHCMRHTKPMDSGFELMRSHQQCVP